MPRPRDPLTLESATEVRWEGSALELWRRRLRSIGFERGHAVTFVAGNQVIGAAVWEFESAADAG